MREPAMVRETVPWTKKHLLGIEELNTQEICLILDTAESFREVSAREIKKVPALRGKTVVNLFYEASTRTRTSFEVAAKRLSADVLNIATSASSVVKGETLVDTVHNLEAYQIDILVIRHACSGAPHFLAKHAQASVINAGDGLHEHPTQALLDMFTIRHHKGTIAGLTVAIIGDIYHSRVARSDILALKKLGANVVLCGPPTLVPRHFAEMGVKMTYDVEEAIADADVLYSLRMQFERQQANFLPSIEEYIRLFGLNTERVNKAKPDCIVMHPGPINRGIEMTSDVADSPRSVILDQVTNGVAVRMAVMFLLARAAPEQNVRRARPVRQRP
jgi:aspartate carbamoyltransferase catalytic subunit